MKSNISAKALEFCTPVLIKGLNRERHEEAEELLMNSMAYLRSSLTALKSRSDYEIEKFRSAGGQIVRGEEIDVYMLGESSLERVKEDGRVVGNTIHASGTLEEARMLIEAALADSDSAAYDRWESCAEQMLGEFQNYDASRGIAYDWN